jgi:hypothetical protein
MTSQLEAHQEQLSDYSINDKQHKTVMAILEASQRKKNVPLRNSFLQTGGHRNPRPGLLGYLINSSNGRSLDLYLLHRLAASAGPDWSTTKSAAVWARALGLDDGDYGKSGVSRCWKKLEDLKLISRKRGKKRATEVTTLCEDGSGDPYVSPQKGYFTLPLEYWTEEWYQKLGYPAKAVLLIAHSLEPGFYLPGPKIKQWYGFSADTLHKGVGQLQKAGLLDVERRRSEDWNTAEIYVYQNHYTLLGSFTKQNSAGREPQSADSDLSTIFISPSIGGDTSASDDS